MAELPRLNGVIGALEKGQHALVTFSPADVESAIALATAKYDGVFYEMEHNAYDISNPYQPKEVGIFMPPAPTGAPTGTIQMNDVFVDEREIVYAVDRHVGGLYILEMDF